MFVLPIQTSVLAPSSLGRPKYLGLLSLCIASWHTIIIPVWFDRSWLETSETGCCCLHGKSDAADQSLHLLPFQGRTWSNHYSRRPRMTPTSQSYPLRLKDKCNNLYFLQKPTWWWCTQPMFCSLFSITGNHGLAVSQTENFEACSDIIRIIFIKRKK